MTEFNRTESARWAIESQKVVGELQGGVDKVLAEAAGRGFPSAPGDTLAAILLASQEAKDKLTEANGKLYDDRRGVIFQQQEFDMKLIVQYAKLGMELYRADLLNVLEIEQAQNVALREHGLADVARLSAEIESRQAAIIRGRAEAERQVVGYKVLLARAERETLEYEVALASAQLETATKRLEIIDSIYQVLAAEELELAAQQLRIVAEQRLLVAKQELASVKAGMVPLYVDKAYAKESLAEAITAEMPDKIALENLGYDRAAFKVASGEVDHEIRVEEIVVEVAKQALARATAATEIARAKLQAIIQGYNNDAQFSVNQSKLNSGRTNLDTRFTNQLGHASMEISNSLSLTNHEKDNIDSELSSILANINARATSEASKISASKTRSATNYQTHLISRKIIEGSV